MEGEVLTVKEAAARIRMSERSIYALVASGEIPGRRLGAARRKILIDAADLARYWEASKGAAGPSRGGEQEIKMASRHLRPPSPARRPA